MKPPISITSSQLTPSFLATLEDCSEESIYAPGYIQPHGIVLTLQMPNLTIKQASENVVHFLGISAEELLGQSLQRLFSRTQVKRIVDVLKQEDLAELCNPFELKARGKGITFRSTLHRTADALILELEPHQARLTRKDNLVLLTYHRLQAVILQLRTATSLLDLAHTKLKKGIDR